MERAEFDKFADEYTKAHARNIRMSGESPEYFAEYKVRDVAEYTKRHAISIRSVLDFGAGVGTSVPWFAKYFPGVPVTCLDVSEKSLAVGRGRFGDAAHFVPFDGTSIPTPAATFDLTFAACVFHHIEFSEHIRLLSEIRRVLTPTGMLVVFEHNPLNPLTRYAVNTCEFDENAQLIQPWSFARRLRAAGFGEIKRHYRIFFPAALKMLRPIEAGLTWCPAGAQYSLFARSSTGV